MLRIDGVFDQDFGLDLPGLARELDELNPSAIHMTISSPGGGFHDGLAFYNDLRTRAERGVSISADIIVAASSASVVAVAADTREAREGAQVMIHRAWCLGLVLGNADDVGREAAAMMGALRAADNSLLEIYEARTRLSGDGLRSMLDAETWLTGNELAASGFLTNAAPPPPRTEAMRAWLGGLA